MDFEFWDNCWQRETQPFHLNQVHPFARQFVPQYFQNDKKILLPLSGKSIDILYFSELKFDSVAIEFNPQALDKFFQENHLSPKKQQKFAHNYFELPNMQFWQADFFALTGDQIGKISQVFDRAAYIALPLALRNQYAQHLQNLLTENAQILMVTMDYDIAQMEGPPFYVSLSELQQNFPNADIQELARQSLLDNHPRWKELQLSYLDEVLYLIKF